jgi:hypothetical protein
MWRTRFGTGYGPVVRQTVEIMHIIYRNIPKRKHVFLIIKLIGLVYLIVHCMLFFVECVNQNIKDFMSTRSNTELEGTNKNGY